MLQVRQKWIEIQRNLKEGDDIGTWPMARVLSTSRGRDGLVRSARVETQTGIFVRPITKLCLLESATLLLCSMSLILCNVGLMIVLYCFVLNICVSFFSISQV